jgi:transcriptional regulator with XRE-family HTH domain
MRARGLSQAELARSVGVADAQVSRWRRGQVVPTVRYLQRIAETLDVPRTRLDALAGYPTAEAPESGGADPERAAELDAHLAALRGLLKDAVPPSLWPAYVRACEVLARSLVEGYGDALAQAQPESKAQKPPRRQIGFQP